MASSNQNGSVIAQEGGSPSAAPAKLLRLIDQLRHRLRVLPYSFRTEQVYCYWAKRFIVFSGMRHPVELGAKEVEAFLTHLAVARKVSGSRG